MSPLDESYLFDSSNYPNFDRAIKLSKRLRSPDALWFKGVLTIVIFVAVLAWFVLSGAADERPVMIVSLMAIAVIVAMLIIAILYSRYLSRDNPSIPVRLSTSGHLVVGDRRWSVDMIGRIVPYGASGAVDIKDREGRTMALLYRVQFGSFVDFMEVIRRLRPDLKVSHEAANFKVRLPKD